MVCGIEIVECVVHVMETQSVHAGGFVCFLVCREKRIFIVLNTLVTEKQIVRESGRYRGII